MQDDRSYQYDFSEMLHRQMYDHRGRERKAKTMVAVLRDYLRADWGSLSVLDIGSSTGIIAHHLSCCFRSVVGIDIDENAINYARENFKKDNLKFLKEDCLQMSFPEEDFDIVICAHVYEHVANADRLMTEIHRVMKPGGICYFSAGNRIAVNEPHYNLPLLSVMPRPLAHRYMRLTGKGAFYYEKHLSYWGLKRLIRNFEWIDYTKRIIENPELFHASYMIKHGTMKFTLARLIVNYAYGLCPSFIWLLRKTPQPGW